MKTTLNVIEFLKTQTNEVVLFFSGGKDSLILLDILSKHFKVNLCFMYFVKDLEHCDKFINWAKKKYKVDCVQYPHFMLADYFNNQYYCISKEKQTVIKLKDIENSARKHFNCEWVISGMKMSDSMNRRLMLKTYFMNAINLDSKTAYPLSTWSKQMCLSYIRHNKLPTPINYGEKCKSSGVDLEYNVLKFLQKNYPKDLEKILQVFPFAETILLND